MKFLAITAITLAMNKAETQPAPAPPPRPPMDDELFHNNQKKWLYGIACGIHGFHA